MIVKLQIPELICPECKSNSITTDHGTTTWYYKCNACDKSGTIKFIFEPESFICNCDICKAVKGV